MLPLWTFGSWSPWSTASAASRFRIPTDLTIPAQDNWPGATYRKGRITLDGERAAIYIRSGLVDNAQYDRNQAERQGRVLAGGVSRVLTLPVSSAPDAASAILHGTASDLTQSDVLGLLWLRYHSASLVQCQLRSEASFSTALDTPTAGFLWEGRFRDAGRASCPATPIPLPATVPDLALWVLFVPAAVLFVGIGLVVGGIWWIRRRRALRDAEPLSERPTTAPQPWLPELRREPSAAQTLTRGTHPDCAPWSLSSHSRTWTVPSCSRSPVQPASALGS